MPLVRKIGLRGELIIILSIFWMVVGTYVLVDESQPHDSVLHQFLPDHLRVAVWWGTALVAAILTMWKRRDLTHYSLALLVIMPLVRTCSYLWSWIMYLIPGGAPGYHLGWYGATMSALMIVLVAFGSRIPGFTSDPLVGLPRFRTPRGK